MCLRGINVTSTICRFDFGTVPTVWYSLFFILAAISAITSVWFFSLSLISLRGFMTAAMVSAIISSLTSFFNHKCMVFSVSLRGLSGFMIAVMMSAIMSFLTSIFNHRCMVFLSLSLTGLKGLMIAAMMSTIISTMIYIVNHDCMVFSLLLTGLRGFMMSAIMSFPISLVNHDCIVFSLLLVGLRGFMIAAMMSAIMSSLTSIFNSASTVFTMDIWRRIRTKSSQKELLIVGRQDIIFTIIISIASFSSLTCFMRYIFI